MTERVPEVYREYFEECMRHFSSAFRGKVPKGKRGRSACMKPMADFCGVIGKTITGYLGGTSLPKGELYMRVICYLDLHGYRVIEFERLPEVKQNFWELIGFSVISGEEAAALLNYPRVQDLFRVLRGEYSAVGGREEKMLNIWKEKKEELRARKKKALESQRLDFLFSTRVLPFRSDQIVESIKSTGSQSSCRKATLSIMRGVLSFFEEGLFDNLTGEEIENLKKNDGPAVLQLSAHLSQLSSRLMTEKR